jgi:hypothetical protein
LHNNLLWYSANLVVAAVSRSTEGYEERQRGQHQRGYRLPISILIHLYSFSFYIFVPDGGTSRFPGLIQV